MLEPALATDILTLVVLYHVGSRHRRSVHELVDAPVDLRFDIGHTRPAVDFSDTGKDFHAT